MLAEKQIKRYKKTETDFRNPTKGAAMADSSERKRSLKLSLFGSEPPTARSPRCFGDGAVGLGIVAAMSKTVGDGSVAAPALSRSDPIPIVLARPAARDEDDGDLLESYTYVISHVRGDHVMRVYFDGGSHGVDGNNTRSSGVFFESLLPSPSAKPPAPAPAPPRTSEFLSRCYLCQKELNGLDIFMYRGEKAFCSVECRCQQILSDEHREKCVPEESPCPAPLLFAPSVAAA